MEEQTGITGMCKVSCCYGCLCKNTETPLDFYNIRNASLKALFKVENIYLCDVCKQRAQQAESFVQDVQRNQILLENYLNLTDATPPVDAETQPLTIPNNIPLDSIQPCDDAMIDEAASVTGGSGNINVDVKIKLELRDEDSETLEHLEFIGEDNDLDTIVKEEDEYPLKLLKEELELEGINIKCLRKSVKKQKLKKKDRKEMRKEKNHMNIKDLRIETIYITREECMEERAKMVTDKKYLNSIYKCEDCIKGFNFKASYDKHMEKHRESNGDYECDICKQRMDSDNKLQRHKRYHSLRHKCSECNLTRISRLTIKDHYTAFHCNGYYQYACPDCSKIFKRQVSLRKHISYVHKQRERAQCAFCSKTYATKEVLKSHLMMRHPNEVSAGKKTKRHVCQDCGMAFNAPSQLRNHSIKHSHRRDYYCVECDKSFKSDSILKHHLKTAMPHTNYVDLPLQCLHCDKRFAIRRDLERHTNRVHLNIRPFQCDRCDKAYVNQWSLNEHKRLIHEGYKRPLKFPCPMCDKVFDRNQILKGHIRTHTGERPFQCSKCPAQFSQASILGTHMKLIHLKLTRDGRPKTVNSVAIK